jgi:hypothetical protein
MKKKKNTYPVFYRILRNNVVLNADIPLIYFSLRMYWYKILDDLIDVKIDLN